MVHDAEIFLSRGIPLLGRLAGPFQRLGIVLRDAATVGVRDAEFGLSLGIPLLGLF